MKIFTANEANEYSHIRHQNLCDNKKTAHTAHTYITRTRALRVTPLLGNYMGKFVRFVRSRA